MKNLRIYSAVVLLALLSVQSKAAVLYVNVSNTAPVAPYTSWSAAATNIQDAVNAANPGDQILVTNGVYGSGTTPTSDGTTNRLAVVKPLTILSVNGPTVTLIDGGKTNRCVYLTNGVVLAGFNISNGSAGTGGGLYCASSNVVVSNCVIANNSANSGGGAYSGTLTNCTLSGNTCPLTGGSGGGAAGSILNGCTLSGNVTGKKATTGSTVGGGVINSTLNNCTLSGNSAYGAGASGGGAYNSTLINCTLSNNYADQNGGAASGGALTNCNLTSNSSGYGGGGVTGGTLYACSLSNNQSGFGGGAYYGTTLINCTLSGNFASYGGGADSCTFVNCLLTGNTAGGYGGGAYYGTLINCTVTGNTAENFGGYGGGAYNATLQNTIVYYNNGGSGGSNDYACSLSYCCTPTATGAGNIATPPNFDGSYHLLSGSPCINAGTNAYVTTPLDLAGNLRIAGGTVDMGAYEFQTTSPLTVAIQANLTNVPVGYPVNFTSSFSKGQSDSWNFGDGTVVSNQLSISHIWTNVGNYPVTLTVYDPADPGGVSSSVTIHVKTQVVYYVNPGSINPVAPYDSWSTAATNIQDAIDTALPVPQSLVLVTNGTYQTGGRVAYGSLSNRIVINKPIAVQSVNGPAFTVIRGNPVIGDSAVRCAYLTNNSVLSGFTLTAGATRSAGDATRENSGGAVWCEAVTALVSNCVLIANSAVVGGGGIYGGTITSSTVCSNSAAFTAGNGNGGGANSGNINDCVLFANIAGAAGGGAYNSTAQGSALLDNQAAVSGGGADTSTLNNCTLTDNSSLTGGGANSCILNNTIIYYNSAANGSNYSGGTLNYCCTSPIPGGGVGNFAIAPGLTDSAHISANSPCLGAGSTNYTSGMDIDAQAWLTPPAIGCDEFYSGTIGGALGVSAQLSYTNVAAGFTVTCAGTILGHAAVSVWNFGDGASVTNQIAVSHSWTASGIYQVVLTAYNSSYPGGVSATNPVQVLNQPVHYVSLGSVNPVPPYLSWSTAATNIQDAVAAGFAGGTVLVTNGVYSTGGKIIYGSLSNRVAINKPIAVRSVNGPASTFIQGYQVPGTVYGDSAVRCVYMTNDTLLSGFTLTNGGTRSAGDSTLEQSGAGIYCESGSATITNCIMVSNSASFSAGGVYQGTFNNCALSGNLGLDHAGGALNATLINCVLSSNSASYNWGGGAAYCSLTNCSVIGNSAYYGGGTYYSTVNSSLLASNQAESGGADLGSQLDDCILRNNTAGNWGGAAYASTLNNCLLVSNYAANLGGGVEACGMNGCTVVGNSCGSIGGGVAQSSPVNCIIYYNTASGSGANYYGGGVPGSVYNNCCTTPLPPAGTGNITNAPLFVDYAGGNFRLQSNSPCINSGMNAFVVPDPDLDGNPRIVGGTVDIGAYEYQYPTSAISYAWLQQYGLSTDGSADFADTDGDGMNNWQEWVAGTDPTSSLSVLKMFPTAPTNNPPGLVVSWQSVSNQTYFLQRSSDLTSQPMFVTIQTNIIGQGGTTSYLDNFATNGSSYYYRVGVQH